MSILDLGIIIVYFAVLMAIGIVVSKGVKNNEDAILAGRSFGPLVAGVGKAANLAGGSTSVGGTGYGFTFGISGSWFGLANMFSGFVMAPFAARMWKTMHRGHFATIGDYLGYRFGKEAKLITGVLQTLAYAGFVASQVVATGTIMAVLLGWNLTLSMILSTLIVVGYTMLGGLKAVVYTDFLQLAILLIGMVVILMPVSYVKAGGIDQIMASIPESFTQIGSMGWPLIIGTILIPTVFACFTMQSTYGYIAACKSSDAAWKSNVIASILYIIPALAVIVIGICAFVLFPDLTSSQNALPEMIKTYLPSGLRGVLLAAILAATMSTSSTCLLCASTCFTNDIYRAFIHKDVKENQMLKITRWTLLGVGILTLIISVFYPNIIQLILLGYGFGAGGLLVPVLSAMFWKGATRAGCLCSMICGGGSYVFIQLSGMVTWPPLFASLPIGLIVMVVVSLCSKKSEPEVYDVYFEDDWAKSAKNDTAK